MASAKAARGHRHDTAAARLAASRLPGSIAPMRFHVDYDDGDAISFWVVPDNPRATARVYIFADHVFRGVVEANQPRPVLKDWGWHMTGEVGFVLQGDNVPGLGASTYLEVYDVDTLVLVYRRAPMGDLVEGKLLRYTVGFVPDATIDRALFGSYRLTYTRAETIPEETLGYVFDYHYSSSVYIAGRMSSRRIRRYVHKNEIKTCALIDDPFRLLSRHLLWLKQAGDVADDEARGWRVADYADAIAFARSLDVADLKGLRRAIANLDDKTFTMLSNPLTRQFGCNEPGDTIEHQQYVNALEEIGQLTVVGHSAYPDAFAISLSAAIGRDVGLIDFPVPSREEEDLSTLLRQFKPAQALVEYDSLIVEAVEALIRDQWTDAEIV